MMVCGLGRSYAGVRLAANMCDLWIAFFGLSAMIACWQRDGGWKWRKKMTCQNRCKATKPEGLIKPWFCVSISTKV